MTSYHDYTKVVLDEIVAIVAPQFPNLVIKATAGLLEHPFAVVVDHYKGIEVGTRIFTMIGDDQQRKLVVWDSSFNGIEFPIENVESATKRFVANLQEEIAWLEAEWPRLKEEREKGGGA